jgi:WD40 repeat protein
MWCTDGCALHLWDVAEGKSLDPGEGHFSSVSCLAVTPDGKGVVSGSGDGTGKGHDAFSGKFYAADEAAFSGRSPNGLVRGRRLSRSVLRSQAGQ